MSQRAMDGSATCDVNMLIDCRQVVKRYSSKVVLDKIDLSVKQGEFFGLVGMNGSGKSTLIKAILDLIGINAGTITIQNRSHRAVDSRENVAYLPDRFSPPAHLRGQDFIQYMLRLHGSGCDQQQIDNFIDAANDEEKMKELVEIKY